MQVSRADFEAAQSALGVYLDNNEATSVEAEMLYTGDLSREEFVSVLRYFRTVYGKSSVTKSVQTDVSVNVPGSDASYRLSFESVKDVIQTCKSRDNDAFKNANMIQKRRLVPPVNIGEYDIRLNVKSEDGVPVESSAIRNSIADAVLSTSSAKSVRNKTRFSFLSKNEKFRYDCTVVQSAEAHDLGGELLGALTSAKTGYEIEIEHVGKAVTESGKKSDNEISAGKRAPLPPPPSATKKRQKARPEQDTSKETAASRAPTVLNAGVLAKEFFGASSLLLKLIQGADHVIPNSKKHAVLEEYSALVGMPRDYFVGPKPVTLKKQHMTWPPTPGHISVIAGDYTVTEKADGERRLLFIDVDKRVYTITDNMKPMFTGLTSNGPGRTLLDGEYLESSTNASRGGRALFMCFDAFFVDGKDVRWLPLMTSTKDKVGGKTTQQKQQQPSRLSACARVIQDGFTSTSDRDVSVRLKKFYAVNSPKDLSLAATQIFREREAGLFPYDIDGLIFTPASLGVKADRRDQGTPSSQTKKTGGRWSRVLKWKPPEKNSIDFLVRYHDNDLVTDKDGKVYRVVDLFVSSEHAPPASVLENVLRVYVTNFIEKPRGGPPSSRDHHRRYNQTSRVMPRLFHPEGESREVHQAHLEMDAEGRIMLDDGTEVAHNTIVEFAFDTRPGGEEVKRRWKPMRVRHDKTQRYRETKSIERTANHASVAQDVWESIHDPLTEDMLAEGEIRVDGDVSSPADETGPDSGGEGDEDRVQSEKPYYVRRTGREELASLPMLQFHNAWVKERTLLHAFAGRVTSLLDVGSGKGGDLNKWLDMPGRGLSRVVGVDLSRDNLTNPENGAYARLEQSFRRRGFYAAMGSRRSGKGEDAEMPVVVFYPADAGQRLIPEIMAGNVSDPDDRDLAVVLWAEKGNDGGDETDVVSELMNDPERRVSKLPSYLVGLAALPFDMVSCQFAVHYFFRDLPTLRTFARNVSSSLSTGGFFVGTCLDGRKVDDRLASLDKGAGIRGVSDEDGHIMWSIRKMYDGSLSDRSDIESRVGYRVKVYLESIAQPFDEYLVDFMLLCKVMDDVGLFPVKKEVQRELGLPAGHGGFEELFSSMEDEATGGGGGHKGPDARSNKRIAEALKMNDEHKRYSFLNKWFVFQKK